MREAPMIRVEHDLEALASLESSALAVVMSTVLAELELFCPGAAKDMIDRLAARLSDEVVTFRQRPAPAAVVEAERTALAWLRHERPLIAERLSELPPKGAWKKAIKRARREGRR
jgi:hypothetical protein